MTDTTPPEGDRPEPDTEPDSIAAEEAEVAAMLRASTIPIDPKDREQAVAAALAAWDADHRDDGNGDDGSGPDDGRLDDGADRRQRAGATPLTTSGRRARPRRVSRGLVAAAVVLVFAVAGAMGLRGVAETEMATSADDSSDLTSSEHAPTEAVAGEHDAAESATGDARADDDRADNDRADALGLDADAVVLGDAASASELLDRAIAIGADDELTSAERPPVTRGPARADAGFGCPAVALADTVATGSIRGTPVLVIIGPAGADQRRHHAVITVTGCELLEDRLA